MPGLKVLKVAASTAVLVAVVALASAPATAAAAGLQPKTSRYPFAGYITSPTTITSSSATIVIPTYTCTKKLSAIAAEAVVYDSNGALFSTAEVYVGCSGKTVLLAAITDVDNQDSVPTVTMHAGDTVLLSATCGPSGISVSVDDTTTSSMGSGSSATPETCTQAEIGDDGVVNQKGTAVVPLPSFGSITYTNAMVNGAALGSFGPMQASFFEGKKNVITTGPLTGAGTSFTTTRG